MRTFPKSLASFRLLINERGAQLRQSSFAELKGMNSLPVEQLIFDSRPSRIGTIVQDMPSGGIRVVVQGFMGAKLIGSNVALDGFYKYPDETIRSMPAEEFYEFD